jgi:hypothetical protein
MRLQQDLVHRLGRTLTVGGVAVAAVLAFALPAAAHTPVILGPHDTAPWRAPLVIDGTDPIIFLGVLSHRDSVRSAQLTMQAGQQLNVALGVPNVAPENTLATQSLPRALLIAPDGTKTSLTATIRLAVHNGDLDQDYLILRIYSTTAIAGTYSIVVSGCEPSRFLIATGVESEAFHGILRGVAATSEQTAHWYSTAP